MDLKEEYRQRSRFVSGCKGFTLIEIMIVVVILGLLATLVGPNIIDKPRQARVIKAQMQIKNFESALKLFKLDNGIYPSTEQGLAALRKKPSSSPVPPKWKGPYIKKTPKDPWGNPYIYLCPGVHNTEDYDLFSYGPDGIESSDDIVNWEAEEE